MSQQKVPWTKSSKLRVGRPRCLTKRDQKFLKYIWRWKIASSRSVHSSVNNDSSPYSTYKNLVRLEKYGLLESRHHATANFHVWCLSQLGFELIKCELGELKEDGYQSENHPHDRLVQAFQLGEWSTHQFPNVQFFTEQDLRRRDQDDYPEWVPKTEQHRPDGYTRIENQAKAWILAYEVELSIKNMRRYERSLRFYQNCTEVTRVMWLVGSTQIRDTILRAKSSIRDDSTNFHVFVDLEEYLQKGWDAEVFNERSERLFTLREKYQRICGDVLGEYIGSLKGRSSVTDHLQIQKVIGRSKA